MSVQKEQFQEPLDVLMARDFGHRARLDYLRGWRKRAQGKGDDCGCATSQLLDVAARIAFAMAELQHELGLDWPRH